MTMLIFGIENPCSSKCAKKYTLGFRVPTGTGPMKGHSACHTFKMEK